MNTEKIINCVLKV